MKRFINSFGYAFNGLTHAFRTQLNFKIHCFAAIVVSAAGLYVNLSTAEWLWIVAAIGMVLLIELLNTAIEMLVDLISPERNPKAGAIKDIAAAAVLISALIALAIGLFIFVPKFS